MINSKIPLLLVFLSFLFKMSIGVYANDTHVSGQCVAHILRLERHHQIPQGLLSAIAKTESGKKLPNIKGSVPWPWAANVGGKSIFFKSKAEAVAEVSRLIRKGVRNIDIGCMQINYQHHGHHFESVPQMFEPQHNVEYGAKFLTNLRNEHGSWTKAVGLYHSATLKYQIPYKQKVFVRWQQERQGIPLEAFADFKASLKDQRHYKRPPAASRGKYNGYHPLFFMNRPEQLKKLKTFYSSAQQELAKLRKQREALKIRRPEEKSTQVAAGPQFFKEVNQTP